MVNQSDDDNTQSYILFSNAAMVSHCLIADKIGIGEEMRCPFERSIRNSR